MEFTPIGIIHSPYTDLKNMPIQPKGASDVISQIELYPQYAPGLSDLAGFSHIYLIYHFHKSTTYQLKVTPFLDKVERGLFATRAPQTPQPHRPIRRQTHLHRKQHPHHPRRRRPRWHPLTRHQTLHPKIRRTPKPNLRMDASPIR